MGQNKMRKTTEELSDLVDAEFGGDPDAFLENTDKWLETFRRLAIENERECAEAVAEVRYKQDGYTFVAFKGSDVPVGTKLFTFHPAAQVPGWQPIETAPKNGRHLAVMKTGAMSVIVWLDADHPDADGEGWYEHWNFDPVEPTHWMPLPAAAEVKP